ncbi:Blastula protease 10 [Nymphon striatum]|nr:Blastula protease 10 [Nymphon striatum]
MYDISSLQKCVPEDSLNCMNGDLKQQKFSEKPIIRLWPEADIPFVIDENLKQTFQDSIRKAIRHWQENTCIKFIDETNNLLFNSSDDHVLFTGSSKGCFSEIGRFGGRQRLNLGHGCSKVEVIIHEIGHVVGLIHEQSRSDRDNYVSILSQNIQKSYRENFAKSAHSKDFPYDYLSIMHYDYNAFSRNIFQYNTLLSVDPNHQYIMGTSKTLSFMDKKFVNMAYKCSEDINCLNGGFMNHNCKCICHKGIHGNLCQYGTQDEHPVCGDIITEPMILSTPEYPSRAKEWTNRSCVYQIRAPPGKKVRLTFKDFRFFGEMFGVCAIEHVEVRLHGKDVEGRFYCGDQLRNKTLESDGNDLVILIKSYPGSQVHRNGFNAVIKFIQNENKDLIHQKSPHKVYECSINGLFNPVFIDTNETIIITSEKFGYQNYENGKLCGFEFASIEANDIQISFEKMDIEETENCVYDSLDILDSQHNLLFSFCGTNIPSPQTINENKVKILFSSDKSISGEGFKMKLVALKKEEKLSQKKSSQKFLKIHPNESIEIESTNSVHENYHCKVNIEFLQSGRSTGKHLNQNEENEISAKFEHLRQTNIRKQSQIETDRKGISHEDLQRMVQQLCKVCKDYGMSLHAKKTKVMTVSKTKMDEQLNIYAEQELMETVKQYKYLGTWITEDGKCISEVKRRVAKAKDDFWKCKEFLRANLIITLKKRLLNTYIFSIIGYGSEAWTFNKEIENKIRSFEYWCYRRILKISWMEKVSNKTVLQLMGAEETLVKSLKQRKMRFAGHVLRGSSGSLVNLVLEGSIEGK